MAVPGDGFTLGDAEGRWRPVPAVVDLVARRTPAAVAVAIDGAAVSYRTLTRRANGLAWRLQDLGVGPDVIVGLCLQRSIEAVVGILAVLKAGGAYVPFDPAYPAARLAYMAGDAQARVMLTSTRLRGGLDASGAQVICLDEPGLMSEHETPPPVAGGAERLAYVIYTSGSTGRPKGVAVTHGNLSYSTAARQEYYRQPIGSYLLLSSLAFDSSVAGLFWTLCSGGRLVLPAPGTERDPARLAATVEQERVTHLLALPSLYGQILDRGGSVSLASLRTVVVAGEACPVSLAAEHLRRLPGASLFNEYGPTEATVWSTVHEVTATPAGPRVPIGRPIPGTRCHIVRVDGSRAAPGEAGDLWIGGPGVTMGYLNRPDLTAERFPSVTLGGAPRQRLYRTGDLARLLPDGTIDLLGRADHQVKIRGHRIEPGEIEAVLAQHPQVREAAVVAREDVPGRPRLVAYLVPHAANSPHASQLRAFLGDRLPEFMVPGTFVTLAALPLSPNGKVDRAALPAPDRARPPLQQAYAGPRTALEAWLAGTWASVLQLDRVGIHDRFFELGGTSVDAANVVNRIQDMLSEFVFIVVLFECPTVAELAERLRQHYAGAVTRVFGESAGNPGRPGTRDRRVDEAMVAHAGTLVRSRGGGPRPARRKNPPAMFLLGPPRSGTTLLTAMLAGHPGLFAASELNLLGFDTLAERQAVFHGKLSLWLDGAIRTLMDVEGLSADEALARMAEAEAGALPVTELFGRLQRAVAPRILLDKSPAYGLDLETLRCAERDFEQPLYVHLSRHPSAMIRSFVEHHMEQVYFDHQGFGPRQAAELVWLLTHRNVLTFLRQVPADRQAHVRYEDLVTRPEATMRAVCRALGLAFHPDLLEPYREKDRKVPPGVRPESKSMGDPKFHAFDRITSPGAAAGPEVEPDDGLGEPTRMVAAELGYAPLPPDTPGPGGAVAPPAAREARARQTRDGLRERLRQRRAAGTMAIP